MGEDSSPHWHNNEEGELFCFHHPDYCIVPPNGKIGKRGNHAEEICIQMNARTMESRKIAYKWKPELWNHVNLHTNGGKSEREHAGAPQIAAKVSGSTREHRK